MHVSNSSCNSCEGEMIGSHFKRRTWLSAVNMRSAALRNPMAAARSSSRCGDRFPGATSATGSDSASAIVLSARSMRCRRSAASSCWTI